MDQVLAEVRNVIAADSDLRLHLLQLGTLQPHAPLCKPEPVETCEFGLAVWAQDPHPDAGQLERHLAGLCHAGHQKQLAAARRGIALLLAMIEFDDATTMPLGLYGQELQQLIHQVSQGLGAMGLAPLPPLCLKDAWPRSGSLVLVARSLGRLVDSMDAACRALATHALQTAGVPSS